MVHATREIRGRMPKWRRMPSPPPNAGATRNLLFINTFRSLVGQILFLLAVQIMQALPGGHAILKTVAEWLVGLLPSQIGPWVLDALGTFADADAKVRIFVLSFVASLVGLALRAWYLGDRTVHVVWILALVAGIALMWVQANQAGDVSWLFIAFSVYRGFTERFDHEFQPPWWARLPLIRSLIR